MTSFIDAIRNAQYNKWRKEMKVYIWIHKNDIIKGLITEYYLTRPYTDRNDNFVQVSISVDEFVYLEDKDIDNRSLLEREHPEFPVRRDDDHEAGRSDMNYTYPQFVKEHYGSDYHTE
jgi:hypothetical protein